VSFEYYRRLYDVTVLKAAVICILELDIPELPPHPNHITFEETNESTGPMHTTFHLDIRALEMLTVDQLVDQIYEDRLIKRDLHEFVTCVPILCAYFCAPLFIQPKPNTMKWWLQPSNNALTVPKFPGLPHLPFMRYTFPLKPQLLAKSQLLSTLCLVLWHCHGDFPTRPSPTSLTIHLHQCYIYPHH
jgi:hypothetical protein